tara:strand:+ start:2261 stop:4123 length:1863 start_codon:yes stop_codon:yes gene_type:complete
MDIRNKSLNNINLSILALISLAFFLGKWLISFNDFPKEDLAYKLILDSHEDSAMYFHYIKSIINLDFSNSFSKEINEKGLMVVPIGSIVFHALGLKLFGVQSFIFLEFLAIFVFLIIFFLIFKKFEISDIFAISLSSIMFVTPLIFSTINFLNIDEINTYSNNFYNLRFPRPMVAQLYFFIFLYILILSSVNSFFDKKFLIPLSIILSLSFSSFFFIFINQIIAILILLTIKYRSSLFKEINLNRRSIFLSIFIFLLLSLPFLVLILNANEDYTERLGVNLIGIKEKLFLIDHYLEKLLRFKALILYLILIILTAVHRKFFKHNFEIIKVFLIIFISSILSPIFFIIFSNKISFLYHFNNIIIISIILLIIIFIVAFVSEMLTKYQNKIFYKFLFISTIFLSVIFFNFENFKNSKISKSRIEKNRIINLIKENKDIQLNKVSILSFDSDIMIWAILNNIRSLKIIDGTLSIRNTDLIEKDLIETFKFLNLNRGHFERFIGNKKIGYRYLNPEMRQFFWQKYQANSLFTFKDSKDFNENTLKFIQNSSPFYVHQFAIPNFELKRLIERFDDIKANKNFKPDIILMSLSKNILNEYDLDQNKYCRVFNGDLFNLYFQKKYCK